MEANQSVDIADIITEILVDDSDALNELLEQFERNRELILSFNDGQSLIHYAAEYGSVKCIEFLVGAGIDVDTKTETGRTPLHLACEYKQLSAITTLRSLKADITLQDNSGNIPLHYAARENDLECIKQLLNLDKIALWTSLRAR